MYTLLKRQVCTNATIIGTSLPPPTPPPQKVQHQPDALTKDTLDLMFRLQANCYTRTKVTIFLLPIYLKKIICVGFKKIQTEKVGTFFQWEPSGKIFFISIYVSKPVTTSLCLFAAELTCKLQTQAIWLMWDCVAGKHWLRPYTGCNNFSIGTLIICLP